MDRQAGSESGQAEWTGRQAQGQGRLNGQAGGLRVREGKRSKPGGLEKQRQVKSRSTEKHTG
jgi:hypothetical protein